MSAAPKNPARRRVLAGAALAPMLAAWPHRAVSEPGDAPAEGARACGSWPLWGEFSEQFLGQGARVIDRSTERAQSVSEAQAYALFFALVANDATRFEQLLRWTEDNLAQGDLAKRLPAWLWGRRDDGSWGVIDENSATDADLWLAYSLGEAGRLWKQRRLVALSSLIGERILQEETALLPGLGRTLLPGPHGFTQEPGRWRLNPSYCPPFLLRWFATKSRDARWQELAQTSVAVLLASSPLGFAPDWAFYRANTQTQATTGGASTG
ncbi:MAG TPA: cellulose synthase complex periplasmic endoglucanase BcsZ, partial [Burkholderiaceae bacterium]|nr:cellulose synthase complex periplasmic endoglucanase BcsZ [Burkholderiaceae bacterium]